MNPRPFSVMDRMQAQIDAWEAAQDQRVVFLSCYAMMTRNMLHAVDRGEFEDGPWVRDLLHRFADYYFDALDRYEHPEVQSPAVWSLAFDACCKPRVHVLQHLILGVNAHINYDLVFVIYDILHEEWPMLSPQQVQMRYRDHCHVNEVIFHTINAVQDQVVERYSPTMDLVDKAFLTADEWLLHRLISAWREQVWFNAARLMSCTNEDAPRVRQQVADRCVLRGRSILFQEGVLGLRHLF